MAKTKTIGLITPVLWHDASVTEIVLKEPTGGAYQELGEPRTLVRTAEGAGYMVEQTSAIKAYLDRCVVHEGGADILRLMSLADSKRLKLELLGFFTDADEAISRLN